MILSIIAIIISTGTLLFSIVTGYRNLKSSKEMYDAAFTMITKLKDKKGGIHERHGILGKRKQY